MGDPRVRTELDDRLDRRLDTRKMREALAAMGMRTVGDLMRRPPRRYMLLTELTDLEHLPVGEEVTVAAQVVSTTSIPMKQRKGFITEVAVSDGRHQLFLTFFNQRWREKQLPVGLRAAFSGKVGAYKGKRQLTHPQVEVLDEQDPDAPVAGPDQEVGGTERPIPVYGLARELRQTEARRAVWTVLDTLGDVPDPIPAEIRARHGLLELREAFVAVHKPATTADHERGLHRLRWEEAFVLQTELARRRAEARRQAAVRRAAVSGGLADRFDERLPFELTPGQRAVGDTLAADLVAGHAMHRLLQGEVGTGKTVVALRAMLTVVDAGGQAALLAPTEVLAQQHHRSILSMLGPLAEAGQLGGADVATRVVLLTGSLGTAARRKALLDVQSGDAGIVIGTHALLQEQVGFLDLGLVVVDEQHRFGVEQRDLLRGKAAAPPHVLVMTATPIPRTIAMTVFGDLDVSTLTDQPPGRAGVDTHVVPVRELPHYLDRAWQRVREEVAAGHQAFVVCSQITPPAAAAPGPPDLHLVEAPSAGWDEEDDAPPPGPPMLRVLDGGGGPAAPRRPGRTDDDDARRPPRAVLELADELIAGPLAGLRLEVLHGRMTADDKDDVMRRFSAGAIDVLVATTVVEVGVDVPNATAMVIMDAHRFGVSQLHQLRGRVARGSARGVCLLVTDAPVATPARERVDAVAATTDGFLLAELDLTQRREGDVLGATQSGGRSGLQLIRVAEHEEIVVEAREEALALVERDPTLADQPVLLDALHALVDDHSADFLERG